MKSAPETDPLIARLGVLSDAARLRMLRLLAREELSVGELSRALQTPQSTVSRHLKTLHDGGWLVRRTEGTASYYRLIESELDSGALRLWNVTLDEWTRSASPTLEGDDARLAAVLLERRHEGSVRFFGKIGGEWDRVRRLLFGDGFTLDGLLGLVPSDWTVADIGCGTGDAARRLAGVVRNVIAIDREPAMLDAARTRLADCRNVEFRQGDIENLPLDPESIDAAVMSLVFHYLDNPAAACHAVATRLKPGGRLVIVDMTRHDRDEYRHSMGHLHQGFSEDDLRAWARAANLELTQFRRLQPDTDARGPGLFTATLQRTQAT